MSISFPNNWREKSQFYREACRTNSTAPTSATPLAPTMFAEHNPALPLFYHRRENKERMSAKEIVRQPVVDDATNLLSAEQQETLKLMGGLSSPPCTPQEILDDEITIDQLRAKLKAIYDAFLRVIECRHQQAIVMTPPPSSAASSLTEANGNPRDKLAPALTLPSFFQDHCTLSSSSSIKITSTAVGMNTSDDGITNTSTQRTTLRLGRKVNTDKSSSSCEGLVTGSEGLQKRSTIQVKGTNEDVSKSTEATQHALASSSFFSLPSQSVKSSEDALRGAIGDLRESLLRRQSKQALVQYYLDLKAQVNRRQLIHADITHKLQESRRAIHLISGGGVDNENGSPGSS